MKKYAYLARLEELLASLPEQEREDALSYYEEYIDAAGKENEQQTMAALGSPEEVAQKILEGAAADPSAQPVPAPPASGDAAAPPAPLAPPAPAGSPSGAAAPPKAPEPPQAGPAGTGDDQPPSPARRRPFSAPPRPFNRRGWAIFLTVIGVALIVQVVAGLLALRSFGRSKWDDRPVDRGTIASESTETVPEPTTAASDSLAPGGVHQEDEQTTHHPEEHPSSQEPADTDSFAFYDDALQEVELHINVANVILTAGGEGDDALSFAVDGTASEDRFTTSYEVDDGLRKLIVRDTGGMDADEEVTVRLRVPQGFHSVEASVNVGNVVLEDLRLDGLEVEVEVGNITANGLAAGKIELKTGVGNIEADSLAPYGGVHEVELSARVGNIVAGLAVARADYKYELKGDTISLDGVEEGSPARSRNGRYELEAETNTGDVRLTFQP